MLRNLLGFSTESGVRFIPARVSGCNISSGLLRTFRIDKGRRNGVRALWPVLSPEGLVGKISEVDEKSSLVRLFTSSGFSMGGMVRESGEEGIVRARGSGRLVLEGLNLRTSVKAGDRVVSSGLGGVFPAGIPIGIIRSVELDPRGVHRVAPIVPEVELNRVREVIVLSDSAYIKADPLWLVRSRGSLSSLWPDFSDGPARSDGDHADPQGNGRDPE